VINVGFIGQHGIKGQKPLNFESEAIYNYIDAFTKNYPMKYSQIMKFITR